MSIRTYLVSVSYLFAMKAPQRKTDNFRTTFFVAFIRKFQKYCYVILAAGAAHPVDSNHPPLKHLEESEVSYWLPCGVGVVWTRMMLVTISSPTSVASQQLLVTISACLWFRPEDRDEVGQGTARGGSQLIRRTSPAGGRVKTPLCVAEDHCPRNASERNWDVSTTNDARSWISWRTCQMHQPTVESSDRREFAAYCREQSLVLLTSRAYSTSPLLF